MWHSKVYMPLSRYWQSGLLDIGIAVLTHVHEYNIITAIPCYTKECNKLVAKVRNGVINR